MSQKSVVHKKSSLDDLLGLDQVLAHARVVGLAESLDSETLLLRDLVDLSLAALPGRKHLVASAGFDDKVVEVLAHHGLLGDHLKVVHGGDHLALIRPSLLGISINPSVRLNTLKVASEEGVILLGVVGGVRLGTLGTGRAILADDEAIRSRQVAAELLATVLAHLIRGVVEDRAKRKEEAIGGNLVEVSVSVLETSPKTNTLHSREVSLGPVDLVSKRRLTEVKRDIGAGLSLLEELTSIGLELHRVGCAEINDLGAGRHLCNHFGSSSLNDGHFVRGLVRAVSDVDPLVHARGVSNFLGEIGLVVEGLGQLILEGEVQLAAANVDDPTILGRPSHDEEWKWVEERVVVGDGGGCCEVR